MWVRRSRERSGYAGMNDPISHCEQPPLRSMRCKTFRFVIEIGGTARFVLTILESATREFGTRFLLRAASDHTLIVRGKKILIAPKLGAVASAAHCTVAGTLTFSAQKFAALFRAPMAPRTQLIRQKQRSARVVCYGSGQ
jgi:hypothetical protein